jgi:hypothetical protein
MQVRSLQGQRITAELNTAAAVVESGTQPPAAALPVQSPPFKCLAGAQHRTLVGEPRSFFASVRYEQLSGVLAKPAVVLHTALR